MSLPNPIQQKKEKKKISKIWKHFESTDNFFVKRCKYCGDLVGFAPSHLNDVVYFYIVDNNLQLHYARTFQEIKRKVRNVSEFKRMNFSVHELCSNRQMKKHLEQYHPIEYQIFMNENNKRMMIIPMEKTASEQINQTVNLFRFMVMNDISINKMTNREGRIFLNGLTNKYDLTKLIDKAYCLHINQIKIECNDSIPCTICIDEWSSKFYNHKVLGIAAYYLDNDKVSKKKVLGLLPLPDSTASTIRITTNNCVKDFFGDNNAPVCHDTCSTMNKAFNINIEIIEDEKKMEIIDDFEDDETLEGFTTEQNFFVIPQSITQNMKINDVFQGQKNVILFHCKCEAHVLDLCIKRTVDQSHEIKNELTKLNNLFVKMSIPSTFIKWEEYCNRNGIECEKFKKMSNTRFYIYALMLQQYKNYYQHIKVFLMENNTSVKDFDETYTEIDELLKVFHMPNKFENVVDILNKIKEYQLKLSDENLETVPHVVEYIDDLLVLILKQLTEFNIKVKTSEDIHLAEVHKGEMKFKKGRYVCSIIVEKGQLNIKMNENVRKLDIEELFLLLLLFNLSYKYKHIRNDKRLMIGCYLNPQTKSKIDEKYFFNELMHELREVNIPTNHLIENEVFNHKVIKMERGISYDDYWDSVQHMYPHLYYLSLKYRTMAATEIIIERLFSLCSTLQDDKRNRMTFEHFSKLSVLQFNLKKSSLEEVNQFFRTLEMEINRDMIFKF